MNKKRKKRIELNMQDMKPPAQRPLFFQNKKGTHFKVQRLHTRGQAGLEIHGLCSRHLVAPPDKRKNTSHETR